MAVLPVLTYPDKRLKLISKEVDPLSRETAQIIEDLVDTMNSSPGCIGIAAPQVNIHKRIVVVDVSRNPRLNSKLGLTVIVNPVITKQSGKSVAKEGCLSLPELIATVRRSKKAIIEGFGVDGKPVVVESAGFDARALLHEIDHLDGILFLDRVSSIKSDVFRRGRHIKEASDD